MANSEDLALDLEELKQLQSIAKRPRVVSLISCEIRNLEKLSKDVVSAPTAPPLSTVNTPNPLLNYTNLSTFSWDQDDDHLKIYIQLEGVNQEKTEADFKPMSFDIKFHDVQGKNYRFALPKLSIEIVPEECNFIVMPKDKRVAVTLAKASKGNGFDFHSIMDLMKVDVEMKTTIAKSLTKSWNNARSGKTV